MARGNAVMSLARALYATRARTRTQAGRRARYARTSLPHYLITYRYTLMKMNDVFGNADGNDWELSTFWHYRRNRINQILEKISGSYLSPHTRADHVAARGF